MKRKERILLAVIGRASAGKDSVAGFFKKKKFKHISLPDTLRELMRKKKEGLSRENMIRFAVRVAREKGPDYLAKKAWEKAKGWKGNIVISGVRHPAQWNFFKKKGFKLISVVVKDKARYERAKKRKRVGEEKISFKKWLEIDKKEYLGKVKNANIKKVMEDADFVVDNNGTLKDLERNLKSLYSLLKT